MITHIALSKLPPETVKAFELVRDDVSNLPCYRELVEFIRRQNKIVVKSEKPHTFQNRPPRQISSSTNVKTFTANNNSGWNCVFCERQIHLLNDCQPFRNSSHDKKLKCVRDNHLCINCFSSKHKIATCQSKFNCTVCGSRHHTLLHRDGSSSTKPVQARVPEPSTSSDNPDVKPLHEDDFKVFCSQVKKSNRIVALLSTALVTVIDRWGKEQTLRFLIDNGSMSNLFAFKACKLLG